MACSLKDKNGITITNAFHKILNGSERKESKIYVDKGSKFYNRSMKSWLKDFVYKCIQDIMKETLFLSKTYTTLKTKIHINKLDNIVNKYNNKYHKTFKMKPANVKSGTYFDFGIENNE